MSTAPDLPLQPWLHELEISVHGNLTCLCDRSGDLGDPGTGLYADDRRVLSVGRLTCDGQVPAPVSAGSLGGHTQVVAVARHLDADGNDPTVEVRRGRSLRDGGLEESVTLTSRAAREVHTTVVLTFGGDGADLAGVKAGEPAGQTLPVTVDDGLVWQDTRHHTQVRTSSGTLAANDAGGSVTWPVTLVPGQQASLYITVDVRRTASTPFDADPAGDRLDWSRVRVRATDARLDAAVATALADLTGLLIADPDHPDDVFAAAGTPWFLTLFGRDALWTARMTLPFGTDLAGGTLRTLARRQGTITNPGTAEEPGKILHEVRRSGFADPTHHLHLPPVYFGTVDATPLWICLLHEAWRWGLPDHEVVSLRPALDAALGWLERSVDQSADGFLRYVDESGHGLSNQGWKDSSDAMRDRRGRVARAPIALVESQAYAVQAALGAADLDETLLGGDGTRWRGWAEELAARVRRSFWVADDDGPYLAMALDRDGAPVDGVGSNMGHALGTGLLNEDESRLVANRITGPDLLGPYGIGTLGRGNPAFNPIGYHTGSVWSHDTAIGALGLAVDGHNIGATAVLRGLMDASSRFGYRLPELYGGEAGTTGPIPYPASCRPQAWATATAGALLEAILGLRPDAPRRRLVLDPLRPSPFGALQAEGLRIAGVDVSIRLDADGGVAEVRAPDGFSVEVAP